MAFTKPTDVLNQQNNFQDNEVGVTHPTNPSFVRLSDSGDVEIFASEGLGIVLHRDSRSVSIIADNVKFFTKEQGGLRWNKLAFNPEATLYQEPAFIEMQEDDLINIYRDADNYYFAPTGTTSNTSTGID